MNISQDQLVALVTKIVVETMNKKDDILIPIGVSNKHIHLSREDINLLFGKGYQLTKLKDLKQPGQFAAKEVVTIQGPKGQIENVRILGPERAETQVEIALTDSFKLGVKAPIRESGQLDGTPGLKLIGPKSSVEISKGAIVALRHIHMDPATAKALNVCDKDIVDVEVTGERKAVLGNVLARVSDKYELEMHVDTDEANACCLKNGDVVKIIKK